MTAYLSAKEARRLGIGTAGGSGKGRGAGLITGHEQETERPAPSRTPRTPYHTRCRKCGVEFTTMVSETRHMNDEGHRAFELVLNGKEQQ